MLYRQFFCKSLGLLVALMLALGACKTSERSNSAVKDTLKDLRTELQAPEFEFDVPEWIPKKGPFRPEEERRFVLRHTRLELRPDWQNKHLKGIAQLSMRPFFYAQDSVILDAKGFLVHGVAMMEGNKRLPLRYGYNGLKLSIALDRSFSRQEEFSIEIHYTARPDELGSLAPAIDPADKGLYFINHDLSEPNKPRQLWTQGETQANSCWFPTFDAPNVKTTQEVLITVESKYNTLSNGKLVASVNHSDGTRTDHWLQDKPHAPYLFMLSVGEYAVVEDRWRGIPVTYHVEPAFKPYAKAIFGHTPEMLEFFSELFDYPYPWDKYAQVVVRDFVSGAMENTSASIFMEQLQVDSRYLADDHWDGIIAHELAHHWFGNLVTAESWAQLPLNESFANYAEYLWLEKKYGINDADALLDEELSDYLYEAETKREPLIRYNYTDREDMFDRHSYSKGCLVLHMLRKYLGDEAFFAGLRSYLKKYAFGKAEVAQLRIEMEEVSGKDLNWFFNQWFLSPGHPELSISHQYSNGMVKLYVKQLQDTAYMPVYRLPLAVDVWHNGQPTRHQIVIDKAEQLFELAASQQPDWVHFDAETQLLASLEHRRSQQEYLKQLAQSNKLRARNEAVNRLQEILNEQDKKVPEIIKGLFAALNDHAWQVRQSAAAALEGMVESYDENAIDKLKQIALNDEHALVRATAINVLSSAGVSGSFFLNTMNDSSYTVLANSLYAYVNAEGSEPTPIMEKYEHLDNMLIVKTLAEFYAFYEVPGKFDWYFSKLKTRNTYELSYLLNFFATYLEGEANANQQTGIAFLAETARKHRNTTTRVSAYAALMLLDSLDGIENLLESIRNEETDPKVLEYYQILKGR